MKKENVGHKIKANAIDLQDAKFFDCFNSAIANCKKFLDLLTILRQMLLI